MYMYNLSVLVEEWLDGTVYDSYLGASEEIDLAAAQVRNHMGDLFSTVHEQVAMPPKMKLGLLKVGVTLGFLKVGVTLGLLKVVVTGKRILVIGSQLPWLEVVLLARCLFLPNLPHLFYIHSPS